MKSLALALLAVAAAGCGGSEVSNDWMTSTDSAGVVILQNDPTHPVWTAETAWRLAEQFTMQIGNRPAPGHDLLAVQHVRRLPDGRFVVANAGRGDVRVFDPKGNFEHLFPLITGADPLGSLPVRVGKAPGDSILVALADARVVVFNSTGVAANVSALSSPGPNVGRPQALAFFDDGTLLTAAPLPSDTVSAGVRRRYMQLDLYDLSGNRLQTFGVFAERSELGGSSPLVFAPSAAVALGDSTFWYGDARSFEVREIAKDGRALRIIRLGSGPDSVAHADTVLFREAVRAQLRQLGAPSASYINLPTFPAFDQMIVDEPGNLWVRRYRWEAEGDHRWSVFAPDGGYLGEVRTPPALQVLQIGPDWVLGRAGLVADFEALYLYPLEKPGSTP